MKFHEQLQLGNFKNTIVSWHGKRRIMASKGKVVFISGASRGLGRSIGELCHAKGMRVYGTSRNPEQFNDCPFTLIPMEVSDSKSVSAAVAIVLQAEGQIDFLVNNAGVGITGPLEEIDLNEVQNHFSINYLGPLRLVQAVLPSMRAKGSGMIINITSIAGTMGLPFRGVYSSAKSALLMTSEAMRLELRPFGIKVTCLIPGDINTNMAAGRYHAPVLTGSAYALNYNKLLKSINQDVDSGSSPNSIARCVCKLMNKSNPKPYYTAGPAFQQFAFILKRVMPSRWFERLMISFQKLD